MKVTSLVRGVQVAASTVDGAAEILTPNALEFVAQLHRAHDPRREALLSMRARRQAAIDAGQRLDFLPETRPVREGSWRIAATPPDLQDRRVEITGPVDRKMMINAFNSGARVFMADFEDANSPTWTNNIEGQANLVDAVRRNLDFTSPEGKTYRLGDKVATLLVRPRGWHLDERHVLVDGSPVSASLFDLGLFLFHNAKELVSKGSGPYLYLPKLESHLEARLWNDVFVMAEKTLGVPAGRTKATVLIETLPAAFEMDEILYELRDHAAGLNAGRWDYIFSIIKKFRNDPSFLLPDRAQVTMNVPFMRAYTSLLVRTCHQRGAHAIGGMAAFVPNRRDPEVTRVALEKVREDKVREANDGFDGTWVAHPDLVQVATDVFDGVLGPRPNQLDRKRDDVLVSAQQLLDVRIPGGQITEGGLRNNVGVGVQYFESWLRGTGAAALHNLMEDAATSEIARSQVWQWIRHKAKMADGRPVDRELARRILQEEMTKLETTLGRDRFQGGRFDEARTLFERVALNPDYPEFSTTIGYERLDSSGGTST